MNAQGDATMLVGYPPQLGAGMPVFYTSRTPGRVNQPIGQLVGQVLNWRPFGGQRSLPRNPIFTSGVSTIQPPYPPSAGVGGF